MHKEFRGVRGSLEGGSAWEVSVEILYVYAFLGGLTFLEQPTPPSPGGAPRR